MSVPTQSREKAERRVALAEIALAEVGEPSMYALNDVTKTIVWPPYAVHHRKAIRLARLKLSFPALSAFLAPETCRPG